MASNYARKKNNVTLFGLCYRAYLIVLAIALIVVYFSVRRTLINYENSTPEGYALSLVEGAKKGNTLSKYLEENVFTSSETKSLEESYNKKLKSATFTVEKQKNYSTETEAYNVLADGKPFLAISLKEVGSKTKLGILTVSEWEIVSAVLRDENSTADLLLAKDGTYTFTIKAPDNFTVKLNGQAISASYKTGEESIEELQYITEVDTPKLVTYTIADLKYEPEIVAYNNIGEKVDINYKNNAYYVEATYGASKEAETMGKEVDVLGFYQTYNKLMFDDLTGAYHGEAQVLAYMVPNSYIYNVTKQFCRSIDITFAAGHTLNGFDNCKVDNYIKYSDKLFSADVYLEKNMTITRTGTKQTDIAYDRVFYAYIDDDTVSKAGWYVIDFHALVAED